MTCNTYTFPFISTYVCTRNLAKLGTEKLSFWCSNLQLFSRKKNLLSRLSQFILKRNFREERENALAILSTIYCKTVRGNGIEIRCKFCQLIPLRRVLPYLGPCLSVFLLWPISLPIALLFFFSFFSSFFLFLFLVLIVFLPTQLFICLSL